MDLQERDCPAGVVAIGRRVKATRKRSLEDRESGSGTTHVLYVPASHFLPFFSEVEFHLNPEGRRALVTVSREVSFPRHRARQSRAEKWTDIRFRRTQTETNQCML